VSVNWFVNRRSFDSGQAFRFCDFTLELVSVAVGKRSEPGAVATGHSRRRGKERSAIGVRLAICDSTLIEALPKNSSFGRTRPIGAGSADVSSASSPVARYSRY
jgi:hypothetical protein